MAFILVKNTAFEEVSFDNEQELESAIVLNKEHIFGTQTILIDYKKKTGSKNSKNTGIPDGFLIDFSNLKRPQLFFLEYELESHDLYEHIGPQIMRFYASFETAKDELYKSLIGVVKTDQKLKESIIHRINETSFENVDSLLNFVIRDNKPGMIVVIDEQTEDFNSLLRRFSDMPEIVTIKKYQLANEIIYQYSPFREGIVDTEINKSKRFMENKEVDTIVCSAREDGFKHAFLNNDSWWAIRISPSLIPSLKWIAMYEVKPAKHVKWIAKIKQNGIQPYKNSGKYIVYLDEKRQIEPIKLDKNRKGVAPQSPRYTTYEKLMNAKKISDLW